MRNTNAFRVLGNITFSSVVAVSLFLQSGCVESDSEKEIRLRDALRKVIEQQYELVPSRSGEALLMTVRSLQDDESVEALEAQLPSLFADIGQTTPGERPQVYEALALLRSQPNVVEALANHYRRLSVESFNERLLSLQVLGELQRPDALVFFQEIIWLQLPDPDEDPNLGERISAREFQEMLQSSAVQGLAYLRAADGLPLAESVAETLHVIRDHLSRAVKISAIDAYMWNQGDAESASRILYEELPEEFHMFVDRPRFHQGASRARFSNQLDEWRKKWQR